MTRHFSKSDLTSDPASAKTLVVDFRKLSALEADPDRQAVLRGLLIEEEDQLAKNREWLQNSERLIRQGRKRIGAAKERLERLDGPNSGGDNRALELMETIQQLYENFCSRVLNEFPYIIKLHDDTVGVCRSIEEARERAQQFADANPEFFVTLVDTPHGRNETFYKESC